MLETHVNSVCTEYRELLFKRIFLTFSEELRVKNAGFTADKMELVFPPCVSFHLENQHMYCFFLDNHGRQMGKCTVRTWAKTCSRVFSLLQWTWMLVVLSAREDVL